MSCAPRRETSSKLGSQNNIDINYNVCAKKPTIQREWLAFLFAKYAYVDHPWTLQLDC